MPYPPWVMEHKKKGMYVNRINESTYRIYRAHSERIKGTGKVRRVVDEYIGTITEKGGLVPTQPKIKGEVRTVRYGGYAILWWFCRTQLEGVLKRLGEDGPAVAASALLHALYGDDSPFLYGCDWTGVAHPGVAPSPTTAPLLQRQGGLQGGFSPPWVPPWARTPLQSWRPRPSSAGSG